jgi:anti-sigma B factor antagonist
MDQRHQLLAALPAPLALEVEDVGAAVVVHVRGDLDLHSANELREVLASRTQPTGRVVVYLGEVSFLDSVALGVLVAALKRLREGGGRLELVCGNERLQRLFRITRLDSEFRIHRYLAAVLT